MRKIALVKTLAISSFAFLLCSNALAVDTPAVNTFSTELATGNKSQFFRVGVQRNMDSQWMRSEQSELWAYWDLTIADWRENRYQNVSGATQNFIDIGLTPTVRWQGLNHQGAYAEAGLGPHINSAVYNNNGRRLSTHLQFGTVLGVGYVMSNGLDLALRVEHFSNGGIKQPNNGVNVAIAKVGYKF